MRNADSKGGDDGEFTNVLATVVAPDGADWCVCTTVDGRRHIISRHATREQASAANAALNASGNYRDFQP